MGCSWPDGAFVTTRYDALNRPLEIRELGSALLASYAYYPMSLRKTVTLGNGTTASYGYSAEGALLSNLAYDFTGTAQDIAYTYTRNRAGEITGHHWNNDQYQWTGASNGTRSYTSNGLNRYTTAAGATLSYDTRGNLTKDGTWTYTFDLDNKLKTAARTGYSATLSYDAEGRLRRTVLAGTTTDLLYDGTDLIAEYNSSGTLLRRYVHGPGIDEPLVWYEGTGTANRTWLYADHLGSIIGTANSAGTSTAIYRYGPFGEPNVTTGIRFRYTGQQYLGGLNLYYYKARFYSPTLGRFLQTDPIGTQDDLNLYAYVGNNPINFNDPDGLTAAELKALSNTIGSWGRDNAGTLAEIGVGFTPAGIYADFYSAATGKTPITGESLSGWERVLVLVPGVSELKNIGRVAGGATELTKSAQKGIRSLEKRIVEHEKKLADFKANPTVRPGMEGQSESVIKAAQESRVRHLEKEIQTFKENIEKLKGGQ